MDDVVSRRAHTAATHATSLVDNEKRISWFSISMHAYMWSCSYSYLARLDDPLGSRSSAEIHVSKPSETPKLKITQSCIVAMRINVK